MEEFAANHFHKYTYLSAGPIRTATFRGSEADVHSSRDSMSAPSSAGGRGNIHAAEGVTVFVLGLVAKNNKKKKNVFFFFFFFF
jgi:hypothetical protein